MFTALSACVLPIGPEFQDPPAVPNYQPFFQAVFPDAESTFQILAPASFEITVSDPNPADQLAVRWVANYPPFVPNATRLIEDRKPMAIPPGEAGMAGRLQIMSPPLTCDKFPLSTEKNLVVIVSDRGFLGPDELVDPVTKIALDRNHRFNYKADGDPQQLRGSTQSMVMAGWRIGGCQ